MTRKKKWMIGCSTLLAVSVLGLCLLATYLHNTVLQNREEWEIERVSQAIEEAHKTGKLILWPSFWYDTPRFYASKQFEMIRQKSGITSLTCIGYPGVPLPRESVESISTMPDLEEVYFQNVDFEEKALLGLHGLPKLRAITLFGCLVDTVSLCHLAELKQVRSLKILCPLPGLSNEKPYKISPEHQRQIVDCLCRFPHLNELVLQECFRSDSETLERSLPKTNITYREAIIDIP